MRHRGLLVFCFLAAVLAAGLLFGWLASRDSATRPAQAASAHAAPATTTPPATPATPAPAATRRREERPNFDRRQTQGTAPARKAELTLARDARVQAAGRLAAAVPGARVDFDGELGSPKSVSSTEGFLTGAGGEGGAVPAARMQGFAEADRHRVVKGFVAEHAALFGHGPEALAEARVVRDYETPHNGMRTTVWQQELAGIRVFESTFQAHVTKRGELVNVASRFVPDVAKAADAGTPNHGALLAGAVIDARQAVSAAAATLGEKVAPAQIVAGGEPEGPARRQQFRSAQLLDVGAEFVWLPQDESAMRLCWEVIFMSKARGEMFRTLVDAESGEALLRHGLTEYIGPASYRVFTSDSPTPMSPGPATPGSTQPAEVARTLVTLDALDTIASPNGWIDDGVNETRGNNVDAHLDINADNVADTPRPQGSPSRVFDFALDLTQAPTAYRDAAVTDLFYWNNYIHDRYYQLGFTEAAGNFQNNNFGRGGTGNDAVQADAQDGSGTNNANFSTPPDGSAGRMQMYVFTGPTPDRDGDFDHEIVIHEYTHGLSNRLVGGGVGISALQPRGMGEGWSDFYGLCLLSEPGDDPNAVYAAGAYATYQLSGMTSNFYFGIRRYPYSTDLTKNPLTFRDIDPTQASAHTGIPLSPRYGSSNADPAAVHGQGEVWCVTLWEARANLIARHGATAGNNLILQLVTDGMKLAPANPTFLQARDAIIQADLVNNAGANRNELWTAFAKRGMGASATSPASSSTTGVVAAFDPPDDLTVTPVAAVLCKGEVGGPFTPAAQIYTLTNGGAASRGWTASDNQPWLDLSAASGTLAAGALTTVTASLNSAANSLANGTYTATVTFTNTTSGVVFSRTITLRIGQVDYFTELFDTSTHDLDNQSFLFTPNASPSSYAVERQTVSAFSTDPTGGTVLTIAHDSFVLATLTGGQQVQLYGTGYGSIYVGANGYITFGAGDSTFTESLAAHFSRPRISALMEHLTPGGQISWKQTADRVAVTWLNVSQYTLTDASSFQIEMFFDGRIRITNLAIAATGGLIGLSRGLGVPADFVESDFSAYSSSSLTLTLPATASEAGGSVTGTLQVAPAPTSPLTVALNSSDVTAATVPATVLVPAGQGSVNFTLTLVDDTLLDGSTTVLVSASAATYAPGSRSIVVADNETTTLTVTLPAFATEGDTGLTGTVTTASPVGAPAVVTLTSSDTTELTVPATVTIPAGQNSVVFPLTVVNDTLNDETQTATITASVAGWTSGSRTMSVMDNDDPIYTINATDRGWYNQAGSHTPTNLNYLTGFYNTDSTDVRSFFVFAIPALAPGETIQSAELRLQNPATGFSSPDPTEDLRFQAVTTAISVLTGGTGGVATFTDLGDGTVFGGRPVSSADNGTSVVIPLNSAFLSQATAAAGGQIALGGSVTSLTRTPGIAEQIFAFTNAGTEVTQLVLTTSNTSLTLVLPPTALENSAPGGGTINVTPVPSVPLTVTLTSSDTSELAVPATVTIPAGQTSVDFPLTYPDDSLLDGTQIVSVLASAAGYSSGTRTILIADSESAVLTVNAPATASEGGTGLTGTVVANAVVDADISVALTSSNAAELTVPASVVIPAGQSQATFPITIVDDGRIDGSVTTRISASVANWTPGSADVTVADNETRTLAITLAGALREGDGTRSGTVQIGGTLATPLDVALLSGDTSELTLPATVTIPAGQNSVPFTATIVDDPDADGAQSVTLTASAATFPNGTTNVSVADNDAHHFTIAPIGGTQLRSAPFPVTVTAKDVNDATITNFTTSVALTAAVPVTPATITAWVNGVWTGNVTATAFGSGVVLSVNDGQGHTGASNPFDVTHGPLSSLAWSTIASPQSVDAPFPVTIRALDSLGNSVQTFAGPVNLAAQPSPAAIETGTGTSATAFPFYGSYQESRLQTLYPASEMGGPATLTALSLNVATASASAYGSFTVRLKQTPLTAYTTASFDATGWTEVYRANVTPSPTGWLTLPFSVPFDYDGTNSLLVDISFDNAATATVGYVYYTSRTSRAIIGYASGTLGDPRTWSGTTGSASITSSVPNLRFTAAPQAVMPLNPAMTGAFAGGEWTGNVSVPFATAGLKLRATSGALTSNSNVFAVSTLVPPSNSTTVLAEDFESGTLNSAWWTLTGTGSFRTINTNLNTPRAGARHMTMDSSSFGTYSRNEATLTVNLAGRTGVALSFWAKEFSDVAHGPPASPFPSTGADFDGVAISADGGTNWYEVQALRTLTATYVQFTVNLDAALAARGLSYGPNFKIRFNQYGNDYIAFNGIAIDDILITANLPSGMPVLALPAQVTEGAGVVNGTVSVPVAPVAPLVLSLSSKSAAKISLPATVTIPAGQTSTAVPLTVLNDPFIDGTKNVVITATRAGFPDAYATVQVVDNDGGAFTLALPATLSEGSGTVPGTLSLSVPALVPITVALTSSDSTEITLPASVTVGAGKTSVTFNATVIEDGIVDGTQSVTVTARLAAWTDGTVVISVVDDGRDAPLDWSTFGNGPAHTGYQPVTLGATAYQAAWTAAFPTSTSGLNQVAVRDGTVFVTPYTSFGDTFLSARDISTGAERWRQTFVSSFSINPPTAAGGRVYVQKGKSTTPGNDSQLWCLDAAGGTALWVAPFGAQWERYFAPTVVNDGVWVDGGAAGGLYGFDTSNGSQRFYNSSLAQYDQWTPSYYNGTIYTWVAGVFRAHDPLAGTILWSSTLSTGTPYSANTVPAFDAGKAFAIGNPNLYAIDLTTRTTAWTVSGTFKGSPATANGTVFALSAGDVKAYNSQTGALVGTYATGNTAIAGQPIVTNDTVIVTAPTATYIFNLQTFALRQTLASGGVASLANGVIYLSGAEGVLRTFRPAGQNAITLALSASSAIEGTPALSGTVSLATARGSDTVIGLGAGGSGRVTLPGSVTIPAGQTSATFQLAVVNDSLLNGSETVSVMGRGPSHLFLSGYAAIAIHDNETATPALSVPASVGEAAGIVTGTLTLSAAPAVNIAVSLTSSDTTEATVPATVIVLAGQTSATFPITIINDTLIDDTQTVTLTAAVPGWTNPTAVMQVTDSENRLLVLSGPYSVYEGLTSTGTVSISGTLPAALAVALNSSNPTQYSVPASVTIPAGQTSVSFTGTAVNDTATDGTQTAVITASASAFTSATVTASAYDNDVHHFGFSTIASPQKTGIAFSTTISAQDINNVTITPFTGTVALTAAGDGGTVTVTPTVSGSFSSGSWTGNVTCATPRTNVVLTATGAGVTGTSNAFEVQLSPAISLSPASLALTLNLGQTTTRTLTIRNTGGGSLTWSLGVAASLSEIVSEGPEFTGTAPVGETKSEAPVSPGAPDPAGIHAEPRTPEIVESALAGLTLQSALNNLNTNNGLVRSAVPNRYAFSEGVTGTNIGDGGNDMYDGGNFLGTNLGTPLSYSDNLIAASTLLGAGGQYFTRKYDGLWVFAADVSGLSYFEITGNLGADGGGSTDSAVLSVVREGVTYRGFVKRVYAATDPSVNHLIIVADNGSVTHAVSTSTDDDYHRLTSLTGVTRIYHVLYAGASGGYIDNTATLNIMNVFLDAISAPDWVSPSPSSGTLAAGASQNVTLTVSAAGLAQGTYNRTLVVTSNDPLQPSASVPVALTVTSVANLSVTPVTGLTANGLRGGPFTPTAQAFTLTNTGVTALNWTAGKLAAWLNLSAASGTLNPGGTVTVTATLNAAANALPSGAYADTIVFTNSTNGLGNTTRPVALSITAFGELAVTPALNLDATGPFGGPFTPASRSYTLSNPGDAAVNWTAGKTASWLTLSSASGTLAPGASTTVTATIAAATTNPGSYTDTITFVNTTNARGNTTRAVTLAVLLPAPVFAPEPAASGGTSNPLSWSTVFGAGEYDVQAAANAAFTNPLSSGWISSASHTFTGLSDGTEYRYRVRARRAEPPVLSTWNQTSQSEFATGAVNDVKLAAGGSVSLLSGVTLTEDFDKAGDTWSGTPFPFQPTPLITVFTREILTAVQGAPLTTPPLPISQGGDKEGRFTGDGWGLGTRVSSTTGMRNGSIEGYFGFGVVGTVAPHKCSFLLRRGSNYSGYFVAISRTSSTTGSISLEKTTGLSGAVLASGTFPADFSNECYRVRFEANGSSLSVSAWIVRAVGGAVQEIPMTFAGGATALTATDTDYAIGEYGVACECPAGSSVFFDDFTVINNDNPVYRATGSLTSPAITPAVLYRWGPLAFTKDTSAAGTALTVDVLNAAGTLLAANVASGADLSAIPAVAGQPSIRLRANLSTTNSANTPRLDDWSVSWVTVPQTFADSAWSPVVSSRQDATKPAITVSTPQVTTAAVLPLAGFASDLSGIASLTVNGTTAVSADGFLTWTTPAAALAPGWNTFLLAATDTAVPANSLARSHTIYLAAPGGDADHDGLPDDWEAAHGLDLFKATGVSGTNGDPDKDGVPNLLERAFGLNPRAADPAGTPVVTTELNPADQQQYLVVRYRRLLAPGTLTYVVEVSRDCATWSSAAADSEEIAPPQPTGDGITETVSVRIKPSIGAPAHSCGFVRVRVVVP